MGTWQVLKAAVVVGAFLLRTAKKYKDSKDPGKVGREDRSSRSVGKVGRESRRK